MLLRVRGDRDDLTQRFARPAEPLRQCRLGLGERALCGRLHLGRGRESQSWVVPEPGEGRLAVRRPEDAPSELGEFGVDAGHLAEARLVDLFGAQVQRRVDADELPIRLGAAGDVHDPGLVLRPGVPLDLVLEQVPVGVERRLHHLFEHGPELAPEVPGVRGRPRWAFGRRHGRRRPLLERSLKEAIEDLDRAPDVVARGDLAVRQAGPQVRDVLLDVRTHCPPARHHVRGLGRRLDGLEVRQVHEGRLQPVHRVDRPAFGAGLELGELAFRLLDQD